jgi:hypothetical protein
MYLLFDFGVANNKISLRNKDMFCIISCDNSILHQSVHCDLTKNISDSQ